MFHGQQVVDGAGRNKPVIQCHQDISCLFYRSQYTEGSGTVQCWRYWRLPNLKYGRSFWLFYAVGTNRRRVMKFIQNLSMRHKLLILILPAMLVLLVVVMSVVISAQVNGQVGGLLKVIRTSMQEKD